MQISPSRPPQTSPPPRPDFSAARATAATITAALTTATAGDSVEISAAARAASDQLTARQATDAPERSSTGPVPTAPMPLPRSADPASGAWPPGTIAQLSTAGAPRWEHLPYAPHALSPQTPTRQTASWPAFSQLTKTSLIVGTVAATILFGVMVS